MPQADAKPGFSRTLVRWFSSNAKNYPWRNTQDPWAILVSEVMLQQTTIPTVLARYEPWMRLFPTPAALAAADEQFALRSWEGLGYYRRVRSLQATARAIVQKHSGVFPSDEASLRALPGIGEYTAAAVLSFAYNKPAALVDANVARVLARIYNDPTPIDSTAGRRTLRERAELLLHRSNPRAYNSALMELGQTICTPTNPLCSSCPVRRFCDASSPSSLPVRKNKMKPTDLRHWDIWLLTDLGLLLEKQPDDARHGGMFRLPQRPCSAVSPLPLICSQKYSVTRFKVTRFLHRAPADFPVLSSETFIPLSLLPSLPLASPDRKLILRLLPQSSSEKTPASP